MEHNIPWERLTRVQERFSSVPDPALKRWLADLQTRAEELRAAPPALVAETTRTSESLTKGQMREYAVVKLLFTTWNGQLDASSLAKRCTTPGATIDLSIKLGLVLDDQPP
ncbi:hypothetical protein [Streptomyces sp. NPDC088752]|uniref:hypothetical protein n=1 Tax=Streptomyces sp. NPDC088752 TaxID=3154963 RepID=UPI0034161469